VARLRKPGANSGKWLTRIAASIAPWGARD
jgi:hypothetical protein